MIDNSFYTVPNDYYTKKKGTNNNRPDKGSRIKVEPIRSKRAIENIKQLLQGNTRDYLLFTLGINTAYRANELLSIKVGQVRGVEAGDTLSIYQTKTNKYRTVIINRTVATAIKDWLRESQLNDDDALFTSKKTGRPLLVPTVNNLVKGWCKDVDLRGNYGSHTLRKTWGYWQRMDRNTPLPLLMTAFGHSKESQTLQYLGIQSTEISKLYEYEL